MAKRFGTEILELGYDITLMVGSIDPSTTGLVAELGAFYARYTTGDWYRKVGLANTEWQLARTGGQSEAWYGPGLDDDIELPVGTTQLTMDMYYRNLVVPSGAILETQGRRITAQESIIVEAGGLIRFNGQAGGNGGSGGGGAAPDDLLIGGSNGGSGNSTTAGSNGSALNDQPPGLPIGACQGGAGGSGSAGALAGGAGGAVGVVAAAGGAIWTFPFLVCGVMAEVVAGTRLSGGSGGGGGGGGGVGNPGGKGGGGGGCILLVAPLIRINGAVEAKGGDGGVGDTNAGGGGGGGGGKVISVGRQYQGVAPDVSGGAGGAAGPGTGAAGTAGNAGYAIFIDEALQL
jgi:hypothetical protein